MSKKEDFTFQQLAQIALGGSKLGNVQISLLHTIINSTLKKLNCENEKVVLCGPAADNLKTLLRKSTCGPTLVFEEKNIKSPIKQCEKLTELEEELKKLELQFDNHLTAFNLPLKTDASFLTMCEAEEQKDESINALLHSKWFFSRFAERSTVPLICRLNKINFKLNKLTDQMEGFQKETESTYKKIDLIGDLQHDLADLRNAIREHQSDFDMSMAEIQGLMDFKENNRDFLLVKAEIRELLNKAIKEALTAKKISTAPRALVFFSPADLENKPFEKKESTDTSTRGMSGKKICGCEEDEDEDEEKIPLIERIKKLDTSEVLRRETSARCSFFGPISKSS